MSGRVRRKKDKLLHRIGGKIRELSRSEFSRVNMDGLREP